MLDGGPVNSTGWHGRAVDGFGGPTAKMQVTVNSDDAAAQEPVPLFQEDRTVMRMRVLFGKDGLPHTAIPYGEFRCGWHQGLRAVDVSVPADQVKALFT